MTFWNLSKPDYKSDYQHSFVNGALEHPFGVPGIECSRCGATWGGSRVLPIDCPSALRRRRHLRERWPLPDAEHRRLREEIQSAVRKRGQECPSLRPGDDLQPGILDIPSLPRFDFLWCRLGTVVVSERVRGVIQSVCRTGVSFAPVKLRKVGKREATIPAPIPESGEPEDIIKEAQPVRRKSHIGPYYEMIVERESKSPPGGHPVSTCSECGRDKIDDKKRRITMTSRMWRGDPVFLLATTLYIIVTDEVRTRLEALRPTNVRFVSPDSF
ncbi:MAG: hypothetical protein FD180_2822 [Planctomycetota bacterium]|nr:MAG: hypothetical protein FD180_2822 [Planctomycetota bacterium]